MGSTHKILEDNFIPKFFEDTEIFITGGSGVVGKALIEKLLRSCNVRRIYVLLRPKKTKTIEQRLEHIRAEKIFRQLKKTRADQLDKLVPVPGNAILPNLGISSEHAKLMENVSIIFHCAATVRFDEPMKEALRLNVGGVLEALKVAEAMKNLKVFMHVSTFFSNPYLSYVEPKVYESPLDWKLCLRLLHDDVDPDLLDTLTRKLIIGFPNTYTFTKNIAESLVNSYRDRLPVVIYRPSIVIFALREPEPGYPPAMMGAMGLFALLFTGLLKIVYIDSKTSLDLTPQDLCVKAMCFFAYRGAEIYRQQKIDNFKKPLDAAPVYMSSSATHLSYKFRSVVEVIQNHRVYEHAPCLKCLLYPTATFTACSVYYHLYVYFVQLIPALLADLLMKLMGHKPVIMSIMRKMYLSLQVMDPFRFNTWESPGTTEYDIMKTELKGTEFEFSTDLEFAATEAGFIEHSKQMSEKIREIFLNEDPSSIPKARKILKIKYWIITAFQCAMIYLLLRMSYNIFFKNYITKIF